MRPRLTPPTHPHKHHTHTGTPRQHQENEALCGLALVVAACFACGRRGGDSDLLPLPLFLLLHHHNTATAPKALALANQGTPVTLLPGRPPKARIQRWFKGHGVLIELIEPLAANKDETIPSFFSYYYSSSSSSRVSWPLNIITLSSQPDSHNLRAHHGRNHPSLFICSVCDDASLSIRLSFRAVRLRRER